MTLSLSEESQDGYKLFTFDDVFDDVQGLWGHEDSLRGEEPWDIRASGTIECTPGEDVTAASPQVRVHIDDALTTEYGWEITDPRDRKILELAILEEYASRIDERFTNEIDLRSCHG